MEDSKKEINFSSFIIFLFFLFFPFGVILRFRTSLLGIPISFHPIDFTIGMGVLYFLAKGGLKKIDKKIFVFFYVCFFSLILSLNKFTFLEILPGFLYFIRFFCYFMFLFFLYNYSSKNEARKNLILDSLLIISFISSLFGWIQYFIYPDLRSLKYVGRPSL